MPFFSGFLCYKSCVQGDINATTSKICNLDDIQEKYQPLNSESSTTTQGESFPLVSRGEAVSKMTMVNYSQDAGHYDVQAIVGQGCGGAATVFAARHRSTDHLLAIKKINLEHSCSDLQELQNEVRLTRQLSHKNLLPFHCSFICNRELWIVMPYMSYGSACDLLRYPFVQGVPELIISFILQDVLRALEYLHRRGQIHRSVKASHILISSKGQVCLSGFRYSCDLVHNGRLLKTMHHFTPNVVRNLKWLSPEVLEQNLIGYTNKSDVYSIGITACELANGGVPFSHMPHTQMLLEKLRGSTPVLLDAITSPTIEAAGVESGEIESLPDYFKQRTFTDGFHQVVQSCLHRDPALRPSVSQLLNHVFFKQTRRSTSSLCDLLETLVPKAENVDMNQLNSGISCPIVDEVVDKLEIASIVDDDEWNF